MKVIITEGQLRQIVQEEVVEEGLISSLLGLNDTNSIAKKIVIALLAGTITFSAVPIFCYQGLITLAAAVCGTFISDGMIYDLSFIGSALIFCVGVNVAFGKKFNVGNMLPALLVAVLFDLF